MTTVRIDTLRVGTVFHDIQGKRRKLIGWIKDDPKLGAKVETPEGNYNYYAGSAEVTVVGDGRSRWREHGTLIDSWRYAEE